MGARKAFRSRYGQYRRTSSGGPDLWSGDRWRILQADQDIGAGQISEQIIDRNNETAFRKS